VKDALMELSPFDRLRVVIADDHPLYREGLARWLRESGIEVLGEVSNGGAAIAVVEETAPDVVIMDLRMPGLPPLDATRRLTTRTPASRVLVLSVSAEEADVTDAILAGASGYVFKGEPVEGLIAGIRAAAAGHTVISPRILTRLLRRVRDTADVDPARVQLSRRELEMLSSWLSRATPITRSPRRSRSTRARSAVARLRHLVT
jgi:DNA-binding NarL/FixJ family response regulator